MARKHAKQATVATATAAVDLLRVVELAVQPLVKDRDRLCVGLSGGVDSMVLLDVLAMLAPRHHWRLSAVHVNHQLSPHAAAWATFCRRACRSYGVPLRVVKVQVALGNSTEAAARDARYDVYGACRADHVLLAHNQDDQVETFLLRLLRGAGAKGLAAMPRARALGTLQVVRPLLDVTRHEIENYARRRTLAWVDDESNVDTRYLRNFLRVEILPRIEPRVPGYRATLTRAAAHLAEAAELLDVLAQTDARSGVRDGTLAITALQRLSAARARNLFRHFLAARGIALPDQRTLGEALRQALHAKADARVRITLGDHTLHRFDGALYLVPNAAVPAPDFCVSWQGQRSLRIPALSATLKMLRGHGEGIDIGRLRDAPVTLRLRRGGERLRLDPARPRRRVKDLFQEHHVPPWVRDRVPFLWSGRHLVWVAGLGVDQRFQPQVDAPSIVPHWLCDGVKGKAV